MWKPLQDLLGGLPWRDQKEIRDDRDRQYDELQSGKQAGVKQAVGGKPKQAGSTKPASRKKSGGKSKA